MAIGYAAIEAALLAWLTSATGLSAGSASGGLSGVYNELAKVPQPAMPYVTFKVGVPRQLTGASVRDEIAQDYIPGNPNGQQIALSVIAYREFTVTVEVDTLAATGAGTAKELLSSIETGAQKPSRRDAFNAAGLAFMGLDPPIDLSERAGVLGRGRCVQDFYFQTVFADVDLGTFIQNIYNVTGTYSGP